MRGLIARRALLPLALVGCGALAGCLGPRAPGDDPARAEAALERGRLLSAARRYRQALAPLATACARADTCSAALPYAAASFTAAGLHEDAVAFFGAVAERHAELRAPARELRGFFRELVFDFRGAEADYRDAIAIASAPRAYERLGKLLLRARRLDAAVEILRTGLERAPQDAGLRLALAQALRQRGDLERSRDLLEAMVAGDNDAVAAWVALGRLRLADGDEAGAIRAFEQGLIADPRSIEARFFLARQALRRGELERAGRLLEEIREIEDSPAGATRER